MNKEMLELLMAGSDIGYGEWNNVSTYSFLHKGLNKQQRIEYEKELEKEDPVKYHEYKIWEKEYIEINNL